jgi:hypothetical protein
MADVPSGPSLESTPHYANKKKYDDVSKYNRSSFFCLIYMFIHTYILIFILLLHIILCIQAFYGQRRYVESCAIGCNALWNPLFRTFFVQRELHQSKSSRTFYVVQCSWGRCDWLEFGTRECTENQQPIGTVAVTRCINKRFSVIMRVSVCRVTLKLLTTGRVRRTPMFSLERT